MGITLDQLVYDPANPSEGANVGAYLKDGSGNALTSTGGALDVNFTATDFDIRDLSASQDNVAISDGTDTLAVNADGSINVNFTATDLDIRDLSHTQDSVRIGDGTDFLAIAADGSIAITDNGASLTVDATDLDIRDLNFSTDSVTSRIQDSSGNSLSSTAGSLHVSITDGVNVEVDLSHVDDSVRLGDGTTLTNVTADNRLFTYHAPNASAQNSTASVGLTAVELAATPLANRKKILVQNNGDKAIAIGGSNAVTMSNGIIIPKGASFELDWGANVDLYAISSAASQDVRVMEVA